MSTLLVWREKLQRIYALYSIYIQKGLQFVTGLVLFWVINSNIGFMKPASSVFCTFGIGSDLYISSDDNYRFSGDSIDTRTFLCVVASDCACGARHFYFNVYFLFSFYPEKAWLVLISGLAFSLKIPFVIPIAFGLLGSPVWIVPASCGIITYYMTDYVKYPRQR